MITYNVVNPVNAEKSYREGVCLSSDTKPTTDESMANGSKLMEMDTSKFFIYDEANKRWREWS